MESSDVHKSVDVAARLVSALRPIGLWYGVVTTVFCLVIYVGDNEWGGFSAWSTWPAPLQWFVYFWVVITMAAPLYLLVWPAAVEKMERWFKAREEEKIKEARVKEKEEDA